VRQVAADSVIPVYADTKWKRAGDLSGNLLATLGDAGKKGDGAADGDEPKKKLPVTGFLQIEAGEVAKKNVCPRQKEAKETLI
jgi:hypothetical protein